MTTETAKPNCLKSYTYVEARTANGDLLTVACDSDAIDEIKTFFAQKINHVETPVDHKVSISQGGYGMYSRYEIEQHKYAGGGWPGCGGYIEVLEIKNPPEGRWGIVIHENNSEVGHQFYEIMSIEEALEIWGKHWGASDNWDKIPKTKSCRRAVKCGPMTPWFYAIGNEELIGDYCFPYGLQDDPVFLFGRQFVVEDHEGTKSIKTCMGTRFFEEEHPEYYGGGRKTVRRFRWVYWDDGTIWKEDIGNMPRPVDEKEIWVVEALKHFKQLLCGKRQQFELEFIDGAKFVGHWVPKDKRRKGCAEGRYLMKVTLKNGQVKEGWVDFKPTAQEPNVVQAVTNKAVWRDKIETITILKSQVDSNGQKWSGVFYTNTDLLNEQSV